MVADEHAPGSLACCHHACSHEQQCKEREEKKNNRYVQRYFAFQLTLLLSPNLALPVLSMSSSALRRRPSLDSVRLDALVAVIFVCVSLPTVYQGKGQVFSSLLHIVTQQRPSSSSRYSSYEESSSDIGAPNMTPKSEYTCSPPPPTSESPSPSA